MYKTGSSKLPPYWPVLRTQQELLETLILVSLLYKTGLKKDIPFKFSLQPFK